MLTARLVLVVMLLACALTGAEVRMLAPASTIEALTDAAIRYEQATAVHVTLSFAATSTIARQIEQGAPCDLVLCADGAWMDFLQERGLIEVASRRDLLANRLVLVAPAGQPFAADPAPGAALPVAMTAMESGLAMGDPAHVPAGRYAQAALESLGWWPALRNHLMPTADVRAALRLVELGEAEAGIVYRTDATSTPGIVVVGTFAEELHPPIRYPLACTLSAGAEAQAFRVALSRPPLADCFHRRGFTVLAQE